MTSTLRGENPAERLLELGAHLGLAGQHRLAALAYASAAGGSSGASPGSRADAFFHAARHLHESALTVPDHPCHDEDLKRARALIQKGLLLARSLPDVFSRTMRLLALLEGVHITQCDFAAATKASKLALSEMRRAADRGEVVWPWWVYFRARMIRVAALHTRQVNDARTLAATAASIAEKRGDPEAAAAFLLTHAHIHLASPAFSLDSAAPVLDRAAAHLRNVSTSQLPESSPLRVALLLLHGLSLLRVGHASSARKDVANAAARTLVLLDRRVVGRTGAASTWVWVPVPALRVLLQHFLVGALRSLGDGGAAWVHAEQALTAAGIARNLAAAPVLSGCVSPRAARAIAVMLLESAARVRLALVDFVGAAPLVRAALLRAAADAPHDVTQCAAFLVAAEYYSLSGTHAHAEVATKYLKLVHRVGAAPLARVALGDVLQMTRAYMSLLCGDPREEDGGSAEGGTCVSRLVRATGLFADGVFHMRKSRVLEGREALQAVLGILQDDQGPNEQMLANALVTLSGLFLVHEEIGNAPLEMTTNATRLAEASRDLITEVRAKRQNYKVLVRAKPNSSVTAEVLEKTRIAMANLATRQRAFQDIVLG